MVDKKSLSERDICSKFITPAITGAGWDLLSQIREEVSFTKGRIIIRGKLHTSMQLEIQSSQDYTIATKTIRLVPVVLRHAIARALPFYNV